MDSLLNLNTEKVLSVKQIQNCDKMCVCDKYLDNSYMQMLYCLTPLDMNKCYAQMSFESLLKCQLQLIHCLSKSLNLYFNDYFL